MGDIINLNRVRKEREREAHRKPGARHIKAGMTKSERTNIQRSHERTQSDLDGKKLNGESVPPESPEKR
ncbi:MAG: DUF4169 family protein [Alphaproteobacteria bacterium]